MKMLTMNLDDIRPYPNNPRKNDNAVDAVAESIRQCSYVQPIIVDEDHVILAGHTRHKALKKLGYQDCSVIVVEGLTEDQKKKYRYLDNKTAEAALWDLPKLTAELEDLDFEDLDFFNLEDEDFAVRFKDDDEVDGVIEYEAEVFADETFKHECPICGFRFN